MAKDKTWADVEWNVSLGRSYVSRTETNNLVKLIPYLNKIFGVLNRKQKEKTNVI